MKHVRVVWVFTLIIVTACSDGMGPEEGGLVGRWELQSVNGIDAPGGLLTWILTDTAITAISGDADCTETGRYTFSGGRLRTTVTGLSGTECGGFVGEQLDFAASLSGGTLTVTITDPDDGVGVFVFRRA